MYGRFILQLVFAYFVQIYRSHSCTSYVPGILKTYTSEFGLRTRRNVWENVSDAPAGEKC